MIERGRIFWAELGAAGGSAPAKRRPVLVAQHDRLNASAINTVVIVAISSNTSLAEHPGNVFVPASASGLPKDSVVNVSQVITLDKGQLEAEVGALPSYLMNEVDAGLRLVLDL